MLTYAKSFSDDRGCVYSLDNLVYEYLCKISNVDVLFDALSKIFSHHLDDWTLEKYSRKGLPASSRYSWFAFSIWGGGLYLQFGQYRDYDADTKQFHIVPVLRLKVNPNKFYSNPLYLDIQEWVSSNCDNGVLVKFDFACDVPVKRDAIAVKSRKEPGLYKGTRYFGQRGKHGRLKVYDKSEEAKLTTPLTRVEYTLCYGKPIVFDEIAWLTTGPSPLPDASELGKASWIYSRYLLEIANAGGDWRSCYDLLDYRTKKKIEPYVLGQGIQLYSPSSLVYLSSLLEAYCLELSLSFRSDGVKKIDIGHSTFVPLSVDDDDDTELPF